MSPAKKPACFVAMAFGHDDTDSLYDHQILPTLTKLGVRAIRIDRRQSNDDINVQIVEQLGSADLCITDLTYARPSVYFEAGFAQRLGQVIYTVRRDHLSEGQPDDLRVHFNLRMKPVIAWTAPNDSSFAAHLEARLRSTFLTEWSKAHALSARNEKDKEDFSGLPLIMRLRKLRRQAMYAMQRAGIRLASYRPASGLSGVDQSTKAQKHLFDGRLNYVEGVTLKGKRALIVSIQSFASVTEGELRRMNERYFLRFRHGDYLSEASWKKIDTIFDHVLIMNLQPLSASRIERAFKYCMPIETAKTYGLMGPIRQDGHDVRAEFKVHIISGIESFVECKRSLKSIIDHYMPKNMATRAP